MFVIISNVPNAEQSSQDIDESCREEFPYYFGSYDSLEEARDEISENNRMTNPDTKSEIVVVKKWRIYKISEPSIYTFLEEY